MAFQENAEVKDMDSTEIHKQDELAEKYFLNSSLVFRF